MDKKMYLFGKVVALAAVCVILTVNTFFKHSKQVSYIKDLFFK